MILIETCKILKNKINRVFYAKKANINKFALTGENEETLLIREKVFRSKEIPTPLVVVEAANVANITKVHISQNVNHLNESEFFKFTNIKEISVEPTNASYTLINGSLYEVSVGGTPKKLVKFISKDNSKKVVLPEGVTEISEKAFVGSPIENILLYSKSESVAFYYTMAEKAKKMGLKSEIINKETYQEMAKDGNTLFNKMRNLSILDGSISGTREENDTLLLSNRKFKIGSQEERILPTLTQVQKNKVSIIRISGNVDEISDELLQSFENVKEFSVEASNRNYKTIDGCLYTKDNVLVRYATGRKEEEIYLPEVITDVKEGAFKQSETVIKKGYLCYDNTDKNSCIFEIIPKLNLMKLQTKILPKAEFLAKVNELNEEYLDYVNELPNVTEVPNVNEVPNVTEVPYYEEEIKREM